MSQAIEENKKGGGGGINLSDMSRNWSCRQKYAPYSGVGFTSPESHPESIQIFSSYNTSLTNLLNLAINCHVPENLAGYVITWYF